VDVVGISSLVQLAHVELVELCHERLQDFCKVLFSDFQIQADFREKLLRMSIDFGSQQNAVAALLENHCDQEFKTCPNDVLICTHFLGLLHD